MNKEKDDKNNKKHSEVAEEIMGTLRSRKLSFNESTRVLNYVKFMVGEHRPQY